MATRELKESYRNKTIVCEPRSIQDLVYQIQENIPKSAVRGIVSRISRFWWPYHRKWKKSYMAAASELLRFLDLVAPEGTNWGEHTEKPFVYGFYEDVRNDHELTPDAIWETFGDKETILGRENDHLKEKLQGMAGEINEAIAKIHALHYADTDKRDTLLAGLVKGIKRYSFIEVVKPVETGEQFGF